MPFLNDGDKNAQKRLQDFAEISSDWFWETDNENRFTWVSPAVEDLLGVTPESLFGTSRESGMLPNSWESHLSILKQHLPFRNFVYHHQASPQEIWVRISGKPVFDDDGVFIGYRGIGTDITQDTLALQEATNAGAALAKAIDGLDEAFVLWDENDGIVVANRVFREINASIKDAIKPGSSFEGFIRAAVSKGLMPQAVGNEDAWIRDRLRERNNPGIPFEQKRQDGLVLLINEKRFSDGQMTSIATDITQQKLVEDRLRESDERYELAVQHAAIWDWKAESDTLIVSPKFWTDLGYSQEGADRLAVSSYAEILHPDDIKNFGSKFYLFERNPELIVDAGQGLATFRECRFRDRSGKYRRFALNGQCTYQANNKLLRSTGLMTDIEDQRLLEEQLQSAQKMEAVGQLTGGIAHDFNNLLSVIQGNIELLQSEIDVPDPRADAILRAAVLGAELTHRLLAFSRQQPLNPQVINLGELTLGLTNMLARTLGAAIDLNVQIENNLWGAYADAGQVESALLNLAINAMQAMPNGGELTLECTNATVRDIEVVGRVEIDAGDYVVLSVTDHGVGMSEDVQARAFEPFFSTKQASGGSGLGLSMVYGFSQQSGGHVTIYSELGAGTTIKLYLPRALGKAKEKQVQVTEHIPLAKGQRILVLEDDAQVSEVAMTMLEKLGYSVVCADDAVKARSILSTDASIKLLLSDVVLPGGMSGPEFADEARQNYPDLKVIFMSGYPAVAAKRNGFLGSNSVLLNKPFRLSQLAKTIYSALE